MNNVKGLGQMKEGNQGKKKVDINTIYPKTLAKVDQKQKNLLDFKEKNQLYKTEFNKLSKEEQEQVKDIEWELYLNNDCPAYYKKQAPLSVLNVVKLGLFADISYIYVLDDEGFYKDDEDCHPNWE